MSYTYHYDPTTAIPDLAGKVIFVTGGTAGIGSATILEIAKHHPRSIYFSGRSASSATSVLTELKTIAPSTEATFVECDLASLSSVKAAAERFLSQSDRLDILICNAGIMATPPGLTKDGYEVQFGTNHLGHALLIQKLLPRVLEGSDSGADKRIIILTSDLQRMAPRGGIQFDKLKTTQDTQIMGGPFMRYGQSKLANVLYARELARRHPNLTAVSVHPGVVRTGLTNNMGPGMRMLVKLVGNMRATPEQGAFNTLWSSFTNKARIENGAMYEPVGKRTELKDVSVDANGELAGKLWDWTEKELSRYMV